MNWYLIGHFGGYGIILIVTIILYVLGKFDNCDWCVSGDSSDPGPLVFLGLGIVFWEVYLVFAIIIALGYLIISGVMRLKEAIAGAKGKKAKSILCLIFGHVPTHIDRDKLTAICKHCGKKLEVSYDMCYGGTYVVRKLEGE